MQAAFPLDRLDEPDRGFDASGNQFANRQGQQAPGLPLVEQFQPRRPQRQQPPLMRQQPQLAPQQANRPRQVPNQFQGPAQSLQEQNFQRQPISNQNQPDQGQPQLPQPRFQRLRTPPGGSVSEQFLQNQPVPNQNQQQGPFQPNQQGQANQNRQQLGAPTLTAFDLTSLANLANQPQFPGQQPQQQQPFRRQPQPPQNNQQQPQRANQQNSFNNVNNQQVPNNPIFSAPAQTELPFIRQVFRPATAQNLGQDQGADNAQPAPETSGGRPTPPPLFVPSRTQNPVQKVSRIVESGFSPMQNTNQAAREVFFEPNGQLGGPQRLAQQQQQRNRSPANPNQSGQPSQPPQAMQQPASRQNNNNNNLENNNSNEPRRKPAPVRRPSQRPQLPNGGQQQADVIRLASSAIQAASDSPAALSPPALPGQPFEPLSTTTLQSQQLGSDAPRLAPADQPSSSSATSTTTEAVSTTTGGQFSPSSSEATTAEPAARFQSSPFPPLRTSATSNFFALTSAAGATSSPMSNFSPALPINAAVAASGGGRRRIPVRQGTTTLARQQQPTTTVASNLITTTNNAPPTRQLSAGSSVRRPEMEEFYETVGASGSNSATPNEATTIDGFGAPSRSNDASSTTTTNTPSTTTDLYGSRLPSELSAPQPAADERLPAASTEAAAPVSASAQPSANQMGSIADQWQQQNRQLQAPQAPQSPNVVQAEQQVVRVPVTYLTTMTYLTTVVHGTHTLETSHESLVRSTELATLNAQLMDQIEHNRPLIEPSQTVAVSSKTKGRATTIVNLKSAVNAYNQELVEALGVPAAPNQMIQPTQVATINQPSSVLAAAVGATTGASQQQPARQGNNKKPLRSIDLNELQEAKKSLITEYVYHYTIKPISDQSVVGQPAMIDSITTTSLRSESVQPSVDGSELMSRLMGMDSDGAAASQQNQKLIDSDGRLRINQFADQQSAPSAINLGEWKLLSTSLLSVTPICLAYFSLNNKLGAH